MSSRHFPPSYPQGFHYTLKHCSGNRSRKWLNVWYILFQAGSKCQMSSGSQSWPIHPRRRVSAHAASGGLRAAPGRLGAGHRAAHLAAPAAPGAEPRKPSGSRAEAEQSIGACGKCSCSDPNRTHLLASTATSIRCACHEQIQLTHHTLLPQSDSHPIPTRFPHPFCGKIGSASKAGCRCDVPCVQLAMTATGLKEATHGATHGPRSWHLDMRLTAEDGPDAASQGI